MFGSPVDRSSQNWTYFFYCFRLVVITIEFSRFQVDHDCDGNHLIRTYLTGLIVLFGMVVIQNAVIVHYSMKGTIVNDEPRRRVPQLLHVRGGIMMLEWIWDIIGRYSLTRKPVFLGFTTR